MKEKNFKTVQREKHEEWRKTNISTQEKGFQNGKKYLHVIPLNNWHENLWSGIQNDLPKYLHNSGVKAHTGTHNLLSSWIVCANLYFPLKNNAHLRKLMTEFLKLKVSPLVTELSDIELEFAFPQGDYLHPEKLLGETKGSRGSGQTSPDVAFIVKTTHGDGIILCECKYTEHSFYSCSARKIDNKSERENNPDPNRCMDSSRKSDYNSICHQNVWGRKYLDLVHFTNHAEKRLNRCPAATAGYQLLRQQALSEGIAQNGKYELVASTVAFDGRNKSLIDCLKTTGIENFQSDWANLFTGKAIFRTWTHQDWVKFVREHQTKGEFDNWLSYLKDRYNY